MEYQLSLYSLVGKGYERGWWTNCKCRYRVFKGARSTKKSYDILGYEVLDKILSDSRRNVLMIRNTFNSHRDSTYATLKLIIEMPDLNRPEISLKRYFKFNDSILDITYLPTGQRIMFRGFDDPQKIQSIRTSKGFLTDVYVEEAFELKSYDQWRKIDGSIRGKLPEGVFHQITFCLNPWNVGHWLNEKFFNGRFEDDFEYLDNNDYQDYLDNNYIGDYGKGLYLHTGTYKINEFRDTDTYDVAMLNLKMNAPDIYKVEALGMWGNTQDGTYPEFSQSLVIPHGQVNNMRFFKYAIGIDTGLSNGEGKIKHGEDVKIRSATTMQLVGLTMNYDKLVCINEYFHSNENQLIKKTEPEIMNEIIDKLIYWRDVMYLRHPDLMKGVIPVYVDCADKGFREGLQYLARQKGLFNVAFIGSTKLRVQTRVDFARLLMAMGEFLFCETCSNLIREIKVCKQGTKGEVREDVNDHCINANEYAWASIVNFLKRWNDFKQR